MLTKYAVIVIETIAANHGRSLTRESEYVLSFENGRLWATKNPRKLFDTVEAAEEFMASLPSSEAHDDWAYTKSYVYVIENIEYYYANQSGWSDVHPFEIVRVVSPKTIEVRQMDAERDPDFEPEFVAGGFAGHCTNQHKQTWLYRSNPDNPVVRARLRKDGLYHSASGPHSLSTEPRKFYDYNF